MFALLTPFLTVGLLGLSACTSDPPMTNSPPPVTVPAATAPVPLPPAQARDRVYAALQNGEVPMQVLNHEELGPMFREFIIYSNHPKDGSRIDYRFTSRPENDYSEKVFPLTLDKEPPATVSPALRAYIALPASERVSDLLLSAGGFWNSPDYQRDGQPLPYTCNFILHFGPDPAGGTLLEVISLGSSVEDGKEWRIAAEQDGLGIPYPRRLPRHRDVAPAPHENQVVLAALVKLLQ